VNRAAPTRRTLAIAALSGYAESLGHRGASLSERALRSWETASGSADSLALRDLPTLRDRSADLVRNEPLAAGAVQTQVDSVVGTGLRLRATPRRGPLGLSRVEAEAWADEVETLWDAVKNHLDIERVSSWRQLLEMTFIGTVVRGDLLTIRRYRKRAGDALGLKLQQVEPGRISNPRGAWDTDSLRAGVEKDADGAAVAYHVADRHPNDCLARRAGPTTWTRVPAFGPQSGEPLALLHLRRRDLGQTRGTPLFAPVIALFRRFGIFNDAYVEACIVNTMLAVLITTPDDGFTDPMSLTAESADAAAAGEIAEDEVKLGSGTIATLPHGSSATIVDPKRPNDAYGAFVDTILMQVGAALGLPFEVLTRRFQSSYSAARAALLEAWRTFYGWREWLSESLCAPVYGWVVAEAVSTGLLEAPGFFDSPLTRAAWLAHEWIGDAPGQLDELKEARAAEIRLSLGITTLQEETASMTGGDWSRNHEQRAEEVRRRREDGLEGPSAESLAEADAMIERANAQEAGT
jgi:lambda family phage portal protein